MIKTPLMPLGITDNMHEYFSCQLFTTRSNWTLPGDSYLNALTLI